MSRKADLVTANRILANQGTFRTFGHVSCRHPDGDKLYISQSRAPGLVTEDDILTMDFDGNVLDDPEARPYGETVIHRAIFRHRDDVNAVVHHHADAIMPFTGVDLEYKPVFHMGALFADGVPMFDEFDEEMGRLVVTEAEGERMAENLGDSRAQLIESHGANVVGADLREAVIGTIYFVMNAGYQYQMELLGEPVYYTGPDGSIRKMIDDVILADIALDRMWEYLEEQFVG